MKEEEKGGIGDVNRSMIRYIHEATPQVHVSTLYIY